MSLKARKSVCQCLIVSHLGWPSCCLLSVVDGKLSVESCWTVSISCSLFYTCLQLGAGLLCAVFEVVQLNDWITPIGPPLVTSWLLVKLNYSYTYLAGDIRLVSEGNRRSLRLPVITCARFHVCTTALETSFGAVRPRTWNSLPRGLRTLDISYKHFKHYSRHICLARPRRFVTFYISALEILWPAMVWSGARGNIAITAL